MRSRYLDVRSTRAGKNTRLTEGARSAGNLCFEDTPFVLITAFIAIYSATRQAPTFRIRNSLSQSHRRFFLYSIRNE